jgi:hypothetical protein
MFDFHIENLFKIAKQIISYYRTNRNFIISNWTKLFYGEM